MLSLGQACQVLGVNQTTLRHWADAGRLRSFRTVGGHRRFSQVDIDALLQGAEPRDGANGELRGPQATLDRIRRRIHGRKGSPEQWLQRFDDEGKSRMRVLGRRLVALATDYVAHKRRRGELAEEAQYLGVEYGRELAACGVGLQDAIAAFIFFRNSLHAAMTQGPGAPGAAPDSDPPWSDVVALEDAVLLAVVEAYEKDSARMRRST